MRVRRALAGVSTLVVAAVLTACSAGGTAASLKFFTALNKGDEVQVIP